MEQGIRHNQGKPQWSQIDFKALEPMVRVLEYGETRVGRDNWKKGLLVRETIESLLRHTFALLAGEDNDQESNQPHIGHILSNAMFISYMLQNRPDMDNRREKEEPKGGVLNAENMADLEKRVAKTIKQLERQAINDLWEKEFGCSIAPQNANIGRTYPKEVKDRGADSDFDPEEFKRLSDVYYQVLLKDRKRSA